MASAELERKFWSELEKSPFVMLGLQGVEDSRTRPMSAQIDEDKTIYFFAARSEHLFQGIGQASRAIATFASKGHDLFANIHGSLAIDDNPAKIDRFWNPLIASWYEQGRDDPDLVLLRFDTESAEIWEATAGSSVKAALLKLLGRDPGKDHQREHKAQVAL